MQITLSSKYRPKWWRPVLEKIALLSILTGASVAAYGGTFTSAFTDPAQIGITLNGNTDANGNNYPIIGTNKLVLTYAENSETGTAVLDDLDGGKPIESFTASFGLNFGPGTATPADGFSFNFGPDIDSGFSTGEEGATGAGDLVVEFDTYDNGAPDNIGIDLKVGGTEVAVTKMTFATLVDSQVHPVSIQLHKNGTINVAWNNQIIYSNVVLTGWAPINGQFAFGARTGCANELCYIENLNIATTVAGPVEAPTITSQPQSQAVGAGTPATFSVGYDGTAPFTFQWSVNGTADPSGTNNVYTIPLADVSQTGAKVNVKITNGSGNVTSTDAVLTVTAQTGGPKVLKGTGNLSLTGITLTFDRPVEPASATNSANYTISPSLSVTGATLQGSSNVVLTTASQTLGTKYTVTISNVKDFSGNAVAANTTKDVFSVVQSTGIATMNYWNNITGGIAGLQADPRFPNNPDFSTSLTDWEYPPYNGPFVAPATGNNEAGSNYGNEITGWVIPATTGNYVFFICSDDQSNLYLSTDETPANKHLIAAETAWSNPRQWAVTSGGGSDLTSKRSDQFTSSEWPGGNTISLTAGKKYYLEAQHVEGGGGDNVEVTMIKAGDPDPADLTASTLTGPLIASTIPADGIFASVVPANGATAAAPDLVSAGYVPGLAKFDKSTVTLKVDNAAVTPTFTTNGAITIVSFKPSPAFAPGSQHSAELDFPLADGSTGTNQWSFKAANYFTLTPDMLVKPDTTKPGFIWNYSQVADIGTETQNSVQRAEDQLAGKLGPNLADPNAQGVASAKGTPGKDANAPVSFQIPGVINLSIGASDPTTPSNNGNFTPDLQEPGAPGTTGTTDNQAAELLTYIDLPAGLIHMGVNSDDDFATYGGQIGSITNLLGTFNDSGGRGASDTIFFFGVQQAGSYAFRTVWENGGGGSNIEWFTTKDDGTNVLINDTAKGGFPAYSAATPAGSTNATPTISVARSASGLSINFTGSLQSAADIIGPWTDVTGTSPQTVTPTDTRKFYRSKQ